MTCPSLRKTLVPTAILFIFLGGCTIPENPNVTAARSVCAAAYADPALNPIRERIPFGDAQAEKASMAQLSDPAKPNAAERAVLQLYDAANRRCWDAWDRVGTSPYVQQARTAVSSALAELYGGQGSYGDFNRKRSNAIAEMNARLREAEARERAAHRSQMMICDGWNRGPFTTLHCF